MAHRLPLADIKFLADFHAYCLTRGDEAYVYVSHDNCACAQFLKDTGRAANPSVGWTWTGDDRVEHDFPAGLDNALVGVGDYRPNRRTFSALATRIEALLADAPLASIGGPT